MLAVPVSLTRAALAAPTAQAPGSLRRSTFTPHLGATFRMTGGGDDVDVVLTDIDDLRPLLQAADEDRFAVFFSAPVTQPRTEGIRSFQRAGARDITLFVSPVDRGVSAVRYQAIVNRSMQAT